MVPVLGTKDSWEVLKEQFVFGQLLLFPSKNNEYSKVTNLSIFRPLVSILKLWATCTPLKWKKSKDISKWIYGGYFKGQKATLNVFIEHLWKQRFGSEWGSKSHLFSHSAISNLRRKSFSLSRSEINFCSYFNFYVELWCWICVEVKISFGHVDCWTAVQPFTIISFNHSLIKFSKETYSFSVIHS